jgi:hypothetical protein
VLAELGESGENTYVKNPNAMAFVNRKLIRDEVDEFARVADEREHAQLGVGRCRLTVSNPELKASLVYAIRVLA